MTTITTRRVLVAVLDWGLGHATRSIPIITMLKSLDCEVMIASSGAALQLLKEEFPSGIFFDLPPYNPVYRKDGRMVYAMVTQLPHFVATIKREHEVVKKLVEDHNINIIISDNRYGCWSANVKSVFITHQSNILMPKRFGWLSGLIRMINHRLMRRFDICWIPDYPGKESLAGSLTDFGATDFHREVAFIGPLSRFTSNLPENNKYQYDVLAICSGPEPQRSILENILRKELFQFNKPFLLVRGVIDSKEPIGHGKGVIVNYLKSTELNNAIINSRLVIARSGFSTVMDMAALGSRAVFVPTPGQTEQQYLASRLMEMGVSYFVQQDNLSIDDLLEQEKNFNGFEKRIASRSNYLMKELIKVLNLS